MQVSRLDRISKMARSFGFHLPRVGICQSWSIFCIQSTHVWMHTTWHWQISIPLRLRERRYPVTDPTCIRRPCVSWIRIHIWRWIRKKWWWSPLERIIPHSDQLSTCQWRRVGMTISKAKGPWEWRVSQGKGKRKGDWMECQVWIYWERRGWNEPLGYRGMHHGWTALKIPSRVSYSRV